MNKEIFEKYEQIVLDSLELHKKQREYFSSFDCPVLPFVTLKFGRRLGATTFIKKHCASNDLIIVHNEMIKKQFWLNEVPAKILTTYEIEYLEHHKGLRPERVWIDSPTLIDRHKLFRDFPSVKQIIFL